MSGKPTSSQAESHFQITSILHTADEDDLLNQFQAQQV